MLDKNVSCDTNYETLIRLVDPNNLVALLRESPFHIDSLLQLSEVSKHNGDNGLAGEFIGTHLELVLDSADIWQQDIFHNEFLHDSVLYLSRV